MNIQDTVTESPSPKASAKDNIELNTKANSYVNFNKQLNENKQLNKSNKEILIKALKSFRLTTSREENIKPYYIFNDNQMMEIIKRNPRTNDELKKVSGFANVKYGKL